MIDPRGLSFTNWVGQTVLLIQQYGFMPKVLDDSRWREWGDYVAGLPQFAAVGVPRPTNFSDWQRWAHAFNQQVRTLGI